MCATNRFSVWRRQTYTVGPLPDMSLPLPTLRITPNPEVSVKWYGFSAFEAVVILEILPVTGLQSLVP